MIYLIINVSVAIIFTLIGSFTFWPITQALDFYHPIVLFIGGYAIGIILLILWLLICGLITVDIKKEYEKPKSICRFALHQGLSYIRMLAMIRIKTHNIEQMPKNKTVLLVCNHRSNFDNFVLTEKLFLNSFISFITKPSNSKIPLAKPFLHQLGYLSIDRNNPLQSLEVMKKASEKISNNTTSIAVFPEGTRSKDGKVGPFHEGVFNIAVRAHCPIVICTLKGTEKIHKKYPLPTNVKLDFLGVLNYEDYEGMTAKAISDEVRNMMINNLGE